MNRPLLIAAALVCVMAAPALAQAPAHGHGGPRHGAMLRGFDANQDGQITRAEVDARIQADFAAADANRNGSLDQAELTAHREARMAERRAAMEAYRAQSGQAAPPAGQAGRRAPPDPAAVFARLDWDANGAVDSAEFAAMPRAMMARADRNGDGVVSAEELQRGQHRRGDRRAPPPPAE